MKSSFEEYMEKLISKNPKQPEFHQAVKEVAESIWDFIQDNPQYLHANILDRIVEPERVIMFRVPWTDDKGNVNVNKGYRVEFNSAIGPYKGGLRFHSSVNLGILKFTWSSEHYSEKQISDEILQNDFDIIESKDIGKNVYSPLADYYIENRDELRKKILTRYSSYVEKILFSSMKKMKSSSDNDLIGYLMLKCKKLALDKH